MPSLQPGLEYDIFISYRQNDNRSAWVTEFVKALEEELAAMLKNSDVVARLYREILGGYDRSSTLSVTRAPDGGPALLVRVEGQPRTDIPARIALGGESVPIVVMGRFRKPEPL